MLLRRSPKAEGNPNFLRTRLLLQIFFVHFIRLNG